MQRYYGSDETSQDSLSRTTRSANKIEKKLTVENSKFLADFDPEKSSRERRKLTRKSYVVGHQSAPSRNSSLFDEHGRYRNTSADLCDCLEDCPGCHYPCPQCSSPKCGPVCRVNRRWAFEYDGEEDIEWVYEIILESLDDFTEYDEPENAKYDLKPIVEPIGEEVNSFFSRYRTRWKGFGDSQQKLYVIKLMLASSYDFNE